MDNLIPVVNRLQDVLASVGKTNAIDLPQIVVIGSQSSGKSSVLENIVGKSFIPRSSGICTRRPLVLQLHQNTENSKEWAEFLHIPNRQFFDFDEVRQEIELETDRETGRNKGISNKAIRLKVVSPNILNLTLVDLPGITKVPVGDQPHNVEELTRNMCLEYILNPFSIVLAVSPANADLANSDALKLAREVDPAGDRTLGVLTKIDLMDEGVDALDALNGNIIPLKRGYIGVINRSQAEINSNAQLSEIRTKERNFFNNHPSYRSVASRHGTDYFVKTLNMILLHHIREHLPQIRLDVQRQLRNVQSELSRLGYDSVNENDSTTRSQLILTLIDNYCGIFVDSIEGRQTRQHFEREFGQDVFVNGGLYGGARLSRAFRNFSARLLTIRPFKNLTDDEIETTITNATGPRPSLFVPDLSFDMLVKRQLTHFQEPTMSCAMDVYEILQDVANQSCFPGLSRFRSLKECVIDTVNSVLARKWVTTQKMVENLISVEKAFINTSHPDFESRLHMIRKGSVYNEMSLPHATQQLTGANGNSDASSFSSDNSGVLKGDVPSNQTGAEYGAGEALERCQSSSHQNTKNDSNDGAENEAAGEKPAASRNFMSFIFSERGNSSNGENSAGVANTKNSSENTSQIPSSSITSHDGKLENNSSSVTMPLGSSFLSSFGSRSANNPGADKNRVAADGDMQVQIIKRLMECYLSISRKNLMDVTPKTIMHFLVNEVKDNIRTELIRALYKEELFHDFLQEEEEVKVRRQKCIETVKILTNASSILGSVRDYKIV